MPKVVIARDGDTLCGIAMDQGFLNCDPLRADPANSAFLTRALKASDAVTVPDLTTKTTPTATTKIHTFLKKNAPPVSIRFVHGSQNKHYLDDSAVTTLNVSNYETDSGGLQGDKQFPGGFGFDKRGDDDVDTFKVEVVDPSAGGTITVLLEALRPILKPDGSIDRHDTFAGVADLADRQLPALECQQVASGNVAFRSRYLRVVVDDIDLVSGHVMAVKDMVDTGDPLVEILDQNVRATYTVKACNAAANKCQVSVTAELDRGLKMDLAVRVMRATPTGVVETTVGGAGDDGIVKLADMQKRIQKWVRRCWAQAHIRPTIVTLQTMDLPSDMFTISDATGLPAKGNSPGTTAPGVIGFTISVQRFGKSPDTVHPVAPITVPAGSTPSQTAALIKQQIDALPGLSATSSPNSPEHGDPDGSCDLMIRDAASGRITITNVTADASQDEDQNIAAVALTMTVNFRNGDNDYHVGHPEQRTLVKALDTPGDVVLDIQVVDVIPGLRGFTVPERKSFHADRQPVSGVKNSIIMEKLSSDSSATNPFSLPHEIGHILTDEGLHSRVTTELMTGSGTDATSSGVTDSKRILEHVPAAINWDVQVQNPNGSVGSAGARINATNQVNVTSAHLLH